MNANQVLKIATKFESLTAKVNEDLYGYPAAWWNRLAAAVAGQVDNSLKSNFSNYQGGETSAECYASDGAPFLGVQIPRLENTGPMGDEGTRMTGLESVKNYLAQYFDANEGQIYYSVVFPGEDYEWNSY